MARKGFFKIGGFSKPPSKISAPKNKSSLNINLDSPGEPECSACKLDKTCQSPKMKVSGEGKRNVLLIAEAPGREEDQYGEALIGEAGKYCESVFGKYGLNIHRDCFKANSVNCRPPKNRTPTALERKCCKPYLLKIIDEKRPTDIVLLGDSALESYFIGRKMKKPTLGKWVGISWPDKIMGMDIQVHSAYHPSYGVRSKGNQLVESQIDAQYKQIVERINRGINNPIKDRESILSRITTTTSYDTIIKSLEYISDKQ